MATRDSGGSFAHVAQLHVRRAATGHWHRLPGTSAVAGVGLESDLHASPCSPRQVLIAFTSVYQALQLPPHALRENLLLDGDAARLSSGSRLRLGCEVEMVVMFACEPCGRLERVRRGLSVALGQGRGLMARVTRSGLLREGDEASCARVDQSSPAPLMGDDWRQRVLQVVCEIPEGRWITYGKLAELAGVAPSYCRAFPRLLAAVPEGSRAHPANAVHGRGSEQWDGSGFFEKLLSA